MLRVLAAVVGFVMLVTAIADAFDTIVLARRAQRILRLTSGFYAFTYCAKCTNLSPRLSPAIS